MYAIRSYYAFGGKKRQELEEMYTQTLSSINEKEVVDGTVVNLNKREGLINIGYKSEGVVNMNEFRFV